MRSLIEKGRKSPRFSSYQQQHPAVCGVNEKRKKEKRGQISAGGRCINIGPLVTKLFFFIVVVKIQQV